MYNFSEDGVSAELGKLVASDAKVQYCFPFGEMEGPAALYEKVYAPLLKAMPDLERRDYIVMAGPTDEEMQWVGCAGFYTGTFVNAWLDIPSTGHLVTMRFHEFYRFQGDKIVEVQAIWDIPELMMQANAWPMAPSLGREWCIPGPATQDGLVRAPYEMRKSQETCKHIVDMLEAMIKHPSQGGHEVMELERFWHPRMNWYGPAGIGTGRGIAGFRHWHQIPFLAAMPDRGARDGDVSFHFFADGDYAAVTGWPDMSQTLSNAGWLGIGPIDKHITMCSLDFWRVEDGKIRENWVLVDLLDVYHQIGIDVLARMREFNKARNWQAYMNVRTD
jgi:predicted ester cyclase